MGEVRCTTGTNRLPSGLSSATLRVCLNYAGDQPAAPRRAQPVLPCCHFQTATTSGSLSRQARDVAGSGPVSPMNFDEARGQIADHVERLVHASVASRGPMHGPGIDLTSPAHKNLSGDAAVGSAEFPGPVEATLGHVERLMVAADDQMLCIAHLMAKPEPSWFGHLAVIRSCVEALSRMWFLTDPAVAPLERSRRFANERLYELQHANTLLAEELAGLPDELKQQAKDHLREVGARFRTWAKERGIPSPGGSLGERRPGPTALLALIYAEDEAGVPDAKALGAWHYSAFSAVAHGLPEGMSRYVHSPTDGGHGEQAHLVMTVEDIARSVEPVLTVHEATSLRLAQFFRWPRSEELVVELTAARLFVNRLGGLID